MDLLLAALTAAFSLLVVDSYLPLGAFRPALAYVNATLALVLLGASWQTVVVGAGAAAFAALLAVQIHSYVVVSGDAKVHALIRRHPVPRL